MTFTPVYRFAPSPNGALHLGHAYSALLNFRMARETGGRFLLRIEDIDTARCTPRLESEMLEDLAWLGIEWDDQPRRQSDHFSDYLQALDSLKDADLVYPGFMSRGEVRRMVAEKEARGQPWPRDPDGAPLYPSRDREAPKNVQLARATEHGDHAFRLNMEAAIAHARTDLAWAETGMGPEGESGRVCASPARWGDVVLGRRDAPASYHIAVVVDDALQGVTHVVRGQDLFYATEVHVLLQSLLGLPQPVYHHHGLILDDDGRKLSKSRGDTSLRALRHAGMTPRDIERLVGL